MESERFGYAKACDYVALAIRKVASHVANGQGGAQNKNKQISLTQIYNLTLKLEYLVADQRAFVMPEYRLFCLNGEGRIVKAEAIKASGDDEAIMFAKALKNPTSCELWKRRRLVAKIPAASS